MFITVTAGMSVYVVEYHQGMERRETNFCNVQKCPGMLSNTVKAWGTGKLTSVTLRSSKAPFNLIFDIGDLSQTSFLFD